MSQRDMLLTHAKQNFGVTPDFPFKQYPRYAVLRHTDSERWFALFMNVKNTSLGIEGLGEKEILDIKCKPEVIGSLRKQPGFLPAYHMNKEHWITVLLDGTIEDKQIFQLLSDSFELTA